MTVPVVVQHHHVQQRMRQFIGFYAHKANGLIKLRIDGLVHGSRSKPFRLFDGAILGDDVDFTEWIGQSGRVHSGQITGPYDRTVERMIGFAVPKDQLQPAQRRFFAVYIKKKQICLNFVKSVASLGNLLGPLTTTAPLKIPLPIP